MTSPTASHAGFAAFACLTALGLGCSSGGDARTTLRISGSEVGAEGAILARQLARFEALHPKLKVELRPTPDAADQRHQLYAQWLNARAGEPDVLQLDVIWTAEFAAAGWILPLDRFHPDGPAFFPSALEANRWQGELYALPWFVDVGMLYWRTDLFDHPPATFDELDRMASWAMRERHLRYGLALQGARYEGLTTVFLEYLGGFGGQILGGDGEVRLESKPALDALNRLQRELATGVVSREALTWQEEQARFAFQSGQAAFMRNWPYAVSLLQDASQSAVAGRFGVAPMPSQGGQSTAALGGAQLAINAHSAHPEAAFALAAFLTAPQQMLERAREVGQFPARPALYEGALDGALPIPPSQALAIIAHATPRPPSPAYTELSGILQIELQRALTGQVSTRDALFTAAERMRALLVQLGLAPGGAAPSSSTGTLAVAAGVLLAVLATLALRRRRSRDRSRGMGPKAAPQAVPWYGGSSRIDRPKAAPQAVPWCGGSSRIDRPKAAPQAVPWCGGSNEDARLAWCLSAPALTAMAAVVAFPLLWTLWESLHLHDLRMPWRGRPFVGLSNFAQLLGSVRFREALAHTLFFTTVSVALEIALGLGLALALHRRFRGRGAVRAAVLVPWALPTVVAAILFRFLFDPQAGIASAMLASAGVVPRSFVWFIHAGAAWVPVIAADVWKTTPFVALLLLAGLQGIPESLYEAAAVDGASALQMLRHITLPMLRPTLAVALLFRSLDALRVFDLVYVLTGGGPGTATEPLALLTFDTLLANLRFGLGASLSMIIFLLAGLIAALVIRALGADLLRSER